MWAQRVPAEPVERATGLGHAVPAGHRGLWAAGVVVVATSAASGILDVAAALLRRQGVYGCSALGALSGGLLASTAGWTHRSWPAV